jgi:hypothetical protein
MRKSFLTIALGLALAAAGLPAARNADAAQPPRPEAPPLVQAHYDGRGWGHHHRPPPLPPRHWRHSHHHFDGGGHHHWREPPHRHGHGWRDDRPRYSQHDRFHHHGR